MSEILVNTIKKADGTGSLTVPADTGTVLTTATTASSIPGYGSQITGADQYRLSGNISIPRQSLQVLNNNWERPDTGGFAKIGTGVSEAAGVFTFPETGIWLISATFVFQELDENNQYDEGHIYTTVDDGSNWVQSASVIGALLALGVPRYFTSHCEFLFDVQDTANYKARLAGFTEDVSQVLGNTNTTLTGVTFTRLGDT